MNKNTARRLLPFYLFTFLPLLVSCLSEDPRGALTEDEAYQNASQLELATVAPIYNYIGGNADSQGLQGTYRGVYDLNTYTTDETMLPTRGGDWYDGGFWQNLYLHKWTASDGAFGDTWNYLYKVVVLCNRSISTIDAHRQLLTDAQYQADIAELRALRAMFYFYIMDLWGNVPVVTEPSQTAANAVQSPRSDVFRFIVGELQDVLPLLADEHSNRQGDWYGRMTRPVAHFLLAKLMLNAEIYGDDDPTDGVQPDGSTMTFTVDGTRMNAWQACIHYCNLLEAAGYQLEDDYQANFAVHNETSRENIFTIPMDKYLYANQFKYLFRSRHYSHGSALGFDAENGSVATLSTCNTYGYATEQPDPRWQINFYSDAVTVNGSPVLLADGTPLVYQPLEVRLDLTGSPYEKTAGARMHKYEVDMNAYADGALQSNDIVLFRFADVLLMRAEAKLRNGDDFTSDLEAVRTRVGAPSLFGTLDAKAAAPQKQPGALGIKGVASQMSNAMQMLLDERLRELMWEGWRRNDLIRFGLFHQSYDQRPQIADEQTAFTTLFPIPNGALDLNANLTQNRGY